MLEAEAQALEAEALALEALLPEAEAQALEALVPEPWLLAVASHPPMALATRVVAAELLHWHHSAVPM